MSSTIVNRHFDSIPMGAMRLTIGNGSSSSLRPHFLHDTLDNASLSLLTIYATRSSTASPSPSVLPPIRLHFAYIHAPLDGTATPSLLA
jgi:hypothetical protein